MLVTECTYGSTLALCLDPSTHGGIHAGIAARRICFWWSARARDQEDGRHASRTVATDAVDTDAVSASNACRHTAAPRIPRLPLYTLCCGYDRTRETTC